MGSQDGQATVEWVGLTLLLALSFGAAAVSAAPLVDGRSFGGFLAHRIVCAVKGGCDDGDAGLAAAYGPRTAALVRANAPGLVYEPGERELPVDYERCRRHACADAPDDRDLDAHRSAAGARVTVFTRVLRRGGRTYVQYWLYYPDSNTAWAGSDRVWEHSYLLPLIGRVIRGSPDYPGFHEDDWEGYQVRIDPDGKVWARSTSHGHYQGCKQSICRDRWIGATGWTRVSRGSHAGHIPVQLRWRARGAPGFRGPPSPARPRLRPLLPGPQLRERTSTPEGLRLIPLEGRDHRAYRPRGGVSPPWRKGVYTDPESNGS